MSMISTDLPKIGHYQALSLIYESDRTLVYRACHEEDGRSVVIKVMSNEYPSFAELVRFRNQYAIVKNLEIEGIIKPYALERYDNRYALIMEDVGGISLDEYKQKNALNLGQFLDIAVQLADILHQLHQKNIIHKDIKPANILIHQSTQHIKLLDFSISTLLPKETQTLKTPNVLEGTLAYLSPEQTGRMNRGIDYRSDFYSLGITLYELLAGSVPFTHDDPLELIHAHIAQNPDPLHKWMSLEGRFCPEPLSNIVLKLMAKNAEDRYQSALGLKYDLEKCRGQYQQTQEIELFELGERDLCDRFSIPEKLYGREKEVQTVLDAFERVAVGHCEMMLVAGFSGIGKTAVVNEVHKPIVEKRGYFIKGKFDQFNRNIPFSAFVIAFRDLMGQLLGESDTELANWKTKILKAVGENGQVLIEVIPELQRIIGRQPPVPELSGNAAQNRFNLLFEKFIAVFTAIEHPLTLFLDDLQWADSASLNLMKVLMGESEKGYLLLLGAYRDNEVFPAHPLMLCLGELQKQQLAISTITLAPLSVVDTKQLIAETLSCSVELAGPLTELVYQKTQGNPFFTTQFLRGLYEDGLIVFNHDLGYWECDLVKVRGAALTSDVVEFMAGRLHKLSAETQNMLKLAACIGNQFDLETLAIICEKRSPEAAVDLWSALREGFILPLSEAYKFFQGRETEEEKGEAIAVGYRFLHDRVQQAAYSLIPDDQKQTTHYRIGQRLLQKTPPELQEERIFALVGQLNYGIDALSQPQEREQLAQLNLIASRKAKNASAYRAGREYALKGLSLLTNNPWQEQYEMVFALTELAAEFSALCGDWEEMNGFVEEVIANSHSLVEQTHVYRLQIQALVSRNQFPEAIAIALDFLQQLGITLPKNPTESDIADAFVTLGERVDNCQVEDLLHLPEMKDPEKIAIVQTAQSILAATYISNPQLLPLVTCLAVSLSIEYGNISYSAHPYACYGLLLTMHTTPDVITGVKFGQLACQLIDKLDAKTAKPQVLVMAGSFLFHRTAPTQDTLPLLQAGYTSGLETGNYEFAGYNAHNLCTNAFWCGCTLDTLEAEISAYCRSLEQLNQVTTTNYTRIYWQTTFNLLGRVDNPTLLSGEALREEEALSQWQAVSDVTGLLTFYLYKLMLCYLFGDLESAYNLIDEARKYLVGATGTVNIPAFYFWATLSALAQLQPASEEAAEVFEQVEVDLACLQPWAKYAPMNHQHKVDLVEAEKCRVLGQKIEAIELYDRAIAGAKENEYIHEEALANELFAKFYLDWGREKEAALYMQEAYYCYAQWGAKAKTTDLEQHYPQLLKPILQRTSLQRPLGDRTSSSATVTLSKLTSNSHSKTATVANISSILDFASLLKASQTVSGEIELDRLLSTLMKTILENAGATKGALLLTSETGLMIEAIAHLTDTDKKLQFESLHQSILLDNYPDLPAGLIHTVQRTTEISLLDAETAQTQFTADNYLLRFSPKSLLCLPLLERGNLIGVLYLENDLTADAFTYDRIELLDALCAQAAISLTNARLYQKAQQALTDLQQAQLQLVQNEKMATLGNLVAGVAHEINNPVGFIGANISAAQEYLQDLLEILSLYQKHTSPPEAIVEEIQDFDLDFIAEDFPKLIASMESGVERIRHISTSLRTFSRKDTDKKIEFNLQEGLNSTLLILKYRLKANAQRPAIEIVKNYREMANVNCYAGQINQVFMNILANAIDALDESNQGKTFEEIEKHPNRITISTEFSQENKNVIVRIADNGKGMPEEVQGRIFEQGFTTKDVGKGTGLGMAIAKSIVTEKHGGAIACQSQLGKGTEFIISLPIN